MKIKCEVILPWDEMCDGDIDSNFPEISLTISTIFKDVTSKGKTVINDFHRKRYLTFFGQFGFILYSFPINCSKN